MTIITEEMIRDLLRALEGSDVMELRYQIYRATRAVGGTRNEADRLAARLTRRIGDLPGEDGGWTPQEEERIKSMIRRGPQKAAMRRRAAPKDLHIKAGKSYETRAGSRFDAYVSDPLIDGHWIGRHWCTDDGEIKQLWSAPASDLIAEWRDEPETRTPDVRVCLNLQTNDLIEYGHCWPGDGGITAFDGQGREIYVERAIGPDLHDEFHVFFDLPEGFKGKAGDE